MKVKEIGGCWYPSTGVLARYEAYYYVKIEDRYVMLNRCLEWKDTLRGPIRKGQLDDCIMDIYACDDEKDLEEMIQGTIQYMERSKQYASEHFEGREEPLEMKNGREIDLNLANIGIRRCNNPYCDQTSYEAFYKYLIEKKREELLLDRLDQLQQTIRNSPERYSVEKLIEKYEEQSGTQLSKQQISGLKEVDDKIQTGLIIGRYNLEDYSNFLNSIPDLLSGKKILGYGHFDVDGEFWSYEEIDKSPSVEEMALYNTYTYHTVTYGGTYKRDIFRELSSQSVKKRMNQDGLGRTDKLCVIGTEKIHMGHIEIDNGIAIVRELGKRPTKTKLAAAEISTALEEISREGLTNDVQAQLIGLADKKTNERSEKQL